MRAHLASLVEDFRAHAAETAVVSHRGVRRYATTYGELAEIAGRFAAELERRGIRPGERVVLWGADSAEWIGVFFGCLLRGVMVVPLDVAGDAGFAGRVVRDVGARLVVGDSELLRGLEKDHVPGAKAPLDDSALMPGLKSRPISKATATTAEATATTAETTATTAEATAATASGTVTTGAISETTATTQPISETTTNGNPPFRDEAAKGWATQAVGPVDGVDVPRMELRGIGGRLAGEPLWAVSEAVGLDTPFQIVFTSGTTSEPRGIVHTHRNVLVTLEPIEREIAKYRWLERPFHPLRFLHSLPLSHVFGQFMGLWCPALLAAEVHFAEELEPARVVELIKRERISVLVAVPRVLHLLRVHLLGRLPELEKMEPTSVRGGGVGLAVRKWWRWRRVHRTLGWKFWAVISGGATLPRELEAFWNELGFALIQGYGMTETAALVTLNHPFHIAPGTIGKTLPGREVRIDADGEIFVRGAMLAPAVWQGGAMRQREGEWLATGDLAEENAAGDLRFVGRKGDVIVTGAGMNVHPADLEKALGSQAGVRGCAVVGCEFAFASGSEAVAVVLFSGSDEALAAAVKEANRGLAEYQQIRHWVRWPDLTFPYTSTGKLIRREVARWACERFGGATSNPMVDFVEPFDKLRAGYGAPDEVATVIGEVTGAAATGDSLRLSEDLKLDSLGRVQLQSALEQRFDVELEDDAVAAVETVGELRKMVEEGVVGSQLAGAKLPDARERSMPQGLKPPVGAEAERPKPEGLGYLEAKAKAGERGTEKEERVAESAVSGRAAAGGEEQVYPRWPWWWWVRWMRVVWIEAVMRPLVWVLAKPTVVFVTKESTNAGILRSAQNDKQERKANTGVPRSAQNDKQEHRANTEVLRSAQDDERLRPDGPVLIVCNHVTAFDGALVLYALPGRVRRRVAAAMSGEMLLDYRRARGQGNWALNALAPGAYWLLTALFNVFPLPRARGFRRSFAHAGAAMDRGYSVLIFPEGSRSRDGKMHAFRPGIGLLAKESGVAVVPVGLRGLYDHPSEQSSPGAPGDRARWFHAGKIEVHVGAAVVAADETADAAEMTARLETAVRELVEDSPSEH